MKRYTRRRLSALSIGILALSLSRFADLVRREPDRILAAFGRGVARSGDRVMNHPALVTVHSSLLASAAYSSDAILELQFRSGATYRYFAVPPGVFHALIAAESKGAYFNRYVRNHFSYQRVA